MKFANKIPGLKKLEGFKEKAQALTYGKLVALAKLKYDSGVNNFKVLAIGIEGGFVAPVILGKCRSWLKDEANEPRVVWRKAYVSRAEIIFRSVDGEKFYKADALWLRETFIPYMEFMFTEYKQVLFWLSIGKHKEIKKNVKKRKKEDESALP